MSVWTEVDYVGMLERLLGHVGSEFGISFSRYSFGKFQSKEYRLGDWTFDYDSFFQVRLCRWFNSVDSSCERVPSPTPIVMPEAEAKFEDVLREGVKTLLQRESPSNT